MFINFWVCSSKKCNKNQQLNGYKKESDQAFHVKKHEHENHNTNYSGYSRAFKIKQEKR